MSDILPPEILSQIFLEVDPHTLYTSIRCLSREWKQQVEENLLRSEFQSSRWRVGLRVTRKPRSGKPWRGGIAGQQGPLAPGAAWNRIRQEVETEAGTGTRSEQEVEIALNRARQAHTQSILSRHGALEDELPEFIEGEASSALTHVVPLHFKGYEGDLAMLQFGTESSAWHALFETGEEEGDSSRLDLDFSIVWRFPGDGQSNDELDGWGVPDQENGWLSRFYCSNFDTSSNIVPQKEEEQEQKQQQEEEKVLHTTPLARRVRKMTLQQESSHPELTSGSILDWSDEGHEYMSLCLSLGTEFFVRRSAQANLLMRKLEVEAEADEERGKSGLQLRRGTSSRISSAAPTPRRSSTTNHVYSPRKSVIDPMGRLQGRWTSTTCSSGSRTPITSSQSAKSRASYASVASTPASGCSSPRGMMFPMRSKGIPRTVRIQQDEQPSGSRAPFPSANVSGYSSVKHQPQIDSKEAEASRNDSPVISRSTSSSSTPLHAMAGRSGHCSVPRACFSARLFQPAPSPTPLHWIARPNSSQSFHRSNPPMSGTRLSVWEWSR